MLLLLFIELFIQHLNVNFADYITTSIPWTAPMSSYCSITAGDLEMETTQIIFNIINVTDALYIYGVSNNCYECLYLPLSLTPLHSTTATNICIIIDTQHSYSIGFSSVKPFHGCINKNKTCAWQPNTTQYLIQPFSHHYTEYAHYNISINSSDAILTTTKSHSNKYIPLYIALGCVLFLITCYNIILFLHSKQHNVIDLNQFADIQYSIIEIKDKPIQNKKPRFISLDAFRGLSLIIMIFVNYGGGGYSFFEHSTWNGLTIADLVFPWFIFIMGVAMSITFPRYLKTYDRYFVARRVIIRGIKLFFVAYISCNNAYDLKYIRIMGVLQYFVIAYTFNGLLLILTEPLRIPRSAKRNFFMPEIIIYWKQWIVVLSVLFINLMIVFLLPVTIYGTKCPKGYFGAGGIGDYGKYIECTGGAHRFIDYKLFGHKHVYQHPTCLKYYHTGWYEAESFIGSCTVILLCYFGIYIGKILVIYKTHKQRIIRWIINCIVFGLIAAILCGFKQNGGVIPINKNLWSLSFVCCQASTGLFVLIIFYIFIDVYGVWSGLPFHWLGTNSIVIYVGSEIMSGYFPFGFRYGNQQNHYKLLLSNIIGVTCWICIAAYLFHKKVRFAL